ncbi:MAG: hypothetical protein R3D67_21115 [Hyphomicrobiaceae bacterium]
MKILQFIVLGALVIVGSAAIAGLFAGSLLMALCGGWRAPCPLADLDGVVAER